MRVGFAAVRLDVPIGTPMGGYIDRDGGAIGELDPLSVHVVTWDDGGHRFALVIADVVCVNRDLTAAVRASATSHADHIWVAATHTHAGPETGCIPGGQDTPAPWKDTISAAATKAIRDAGTDASALVGEVHSGALHSVGAIRGDRDATAVIPLDVVVFRRVDQTIGGMLVVLPVHPTVLPADNRAISADLPGAVRRALELRLSEGTPVIVATGAAGDISTRSTRRAQDATEVTRLGELVADQCLALIDADLGSPVWTAGSRIEWRDSVLRLSAKKSAVDNDVVLASARAHEERARAAGDHIGVRIAESRRQGVRVHADIRRENLNEDINADVEAVRIGALGLAGLPGEPFVALGESIRSMAPGHNISLGYVNGYPGYLPTVDAYPLAGYEVLASVVEAGSGERVAEAAGQLLREMPAENIERGLEK